MWVILNDKDFRFMVIMFFLTICLWSSVILGSGCSIKEPDAFRDSIYWTGE